MSNDFTNNLSRRGFLQRSLAGLTVGAGLPLWYAREVLGADEEKKAEAKKAGSDTIHVGCIGIGSPASRGMAIMGEIKGKKGVEVIAVCDVEKNHVERAARAVGGDCKKYDDFRALLDNKDIDAVLIATPDHWHAQVAVEAMRKGKHVYCEKPLTLTIAEGILLTEVAKKTGKTFQVGSQQRSDARFRLACELVRNGRIGKIQHVETRIGANPQSPEIPKADVPSTLNWDMWLGPTPVVDYLYEKKDNHAFTNCHYEFRWWYQFSGGKMTDWGAHHNDIAQWGLGMDESGPIAIEAEGTAPPKEKNRYDCHEHFKVTYTYANGAKVICTHDQMKDAIDPKDTKPAGEKSKPVGHGNGILFVGEDKKWIFVNRGIISASDHALIDEKLPDSATRLYVSNNHMQNFVDGIRTGKVCVCPADVGHRSVTVCHLGVIALRSGLKLKWDPVKQKFDDAEANRWLSRERRAPWKLEA
jgi:predicted dehydrogenase